MFEGREFEVDIDEIASLLVFGYLIKIPVSIPPLLHPGAAQLKKTT